MSPQTNLDAPGNSTPDPHRAITEPQAERAPGVHADPDLQQVLAAWPTLTVAQRARVLAVVIEKE